MPGVCFLCVQDLMGDLRGLGRPPKYLPPTGNYLTNLLYYISWWHCWHWHWHSFLLPCPTVCTISSVFPWSFSSFMSLFFPFVALSYFCVSSDTAPFPSLYLLLLLSSPLHRTCPPPPLLSSYNGVVPLTWPVHPYLFWHFLLLLFLLHPWL